LQLLASIDATDVAGARDHAIFLVMTYTFARVGAVVVVCAAREGRSPSPGAGTSQSGRGGPLFRSLRGGVLIGRPLHRQSVWDLVKRRALAAGLSPDVCCHSFRASGITNYLDHRGTIERAAAIAGHASTRTTQLYNRLDDEITLDESERIRI
jgi:integrase